MTLPSASAESEPTSHCIRVTLHLITKRWAREQGHLPEGAFTSPTTVVELWFRPTFNRKYNFNSLHNNSCSWRADLKTKDCPSYWCNPWSGDKQVMRSSGRVIASYKSFPCFWHWSSLCWCHIVITNKIEQKKVKVQPSQLISTTPRILLWQVRVVVVAVVINESLFPPPSKIEPKKVNYNHQPQKRCKSTLSQTLETNWSRTWREHWFNWGTSIVQKFLKEYNKLLSVLTSINF